MNHYLVSAITSIIDAKGEDIIDNKNEFINVFTASTKGCEDIVPLLDCALSTGAVMIIAQAKNDDNEGQQNATRIAIEILMAEGFEKDAAIDLATAFGIAFNFSYGKEKTDDQLYEDALAHLSRKEDAEAVNILKTLAKKGHGDGLILLGDLYFNGASGIARSYKKAMECYEKADCGDGYSKLAVMYVHGYGCDKSFDRAIELWNKGAELGNAVCMYQLAMVYLNGINGIQKDMQRACNYIKASARLGFSPAVKALATLPKEYTEKTEAEIAELEALADNGDVDAIYTLANCYFKGDGVPKSKIKAVELYTKAAKLGRLASQIALITRYTMDADIPKCWTAAKYWYDKAVKTDKSRLKVVHPDLVKGEELFLSVPKNAKNKRERYEEAGKLGYISAYTAIAKMYRGNEKALCWLELAASMGDLEALEIILERKDADSEKYAKIYDYVKSITEKLQ